MRTAEQNEKRRKELYEILDWLSSLNFWAKQDDTFERREEGTGEWFLNDPKFQGWMKGDFEVLLCPGDRTALCSERR
jgi:hypothetical protein